MARFIRLQTLPAFCFPVKEHYFTEEQQVLAQWLNRVISLNADLLAMYAELHKWLLLGPQKDLGQAITIDVGGIGFDQLVRSYVVAYNNHLQAVRAEEELAKSDPVGEWAKRLLAHSTVTRAESFFQQTIFQNILKKHFGRFQEAANEKIKEAEAMTDGLDNREVDGKNGHWWKQIDNNNMETNEHIFADAMMVASTSIGKLDGGLLKKKLDEVQQAIEMHIIL